MLNKGKRILFSFLSIWLLLIFISPEKNYSYDWFSVNTNENLEETAPILDSNITGIGSDDSEPSPFIVIEGKNNIVDSNFKSTLIDNITKNGFSITNDTLFTNLNRLDLELNNTETAYKLKNYLDQNIPNITTRIPSYSVPFK